MAAVSPIPDGYPRVMPYLYIDGAAAAIEFYCAIFGAVERMRMAGPDGNVGHAELEIGDSIVMLADEHPEMGVLGPKTIGGTPMSLMIYVNDVDDVVARATEAGAVLRQSIEDKFYGDRMAQLVDPFGHVWSVATHIEDIDPEEMGRRAQAAMATG